MNRVLNQDRLKRMIARFTADRGAHLTRTIPEHAVKVTIDKLAVQPFCDGLMALNTDFQGTKKRDFQTTSMGPFNRMGKIWTMNEAIKKEVEPHSTFRVEAGQHRLAAVEKLPLSEYEGLWPAMIFKREFTDKQLSTMRTNRDEVQFKDTSEDVLYQLAPFFRKKIENGTLDANDAAVVTEKKTLLAGKIKTTLNKDWAITLEKLIGEYPHCSVGWTQNQAGILNGSIHNDVSVQDCDASQNDKGADAVM